MALLTPRQVAAELSVSYATVMRMIADGSLPAVCLRAGQRKKLWRVRPAQLEKWLSERSRQLIDRNAYIRSLGNLEPHLLQALLAGDWDVKPPA